MITFKLFLENKFSTYKENHEYDEYILSKEKHEKEMENYKKELDEYKNKSRSIKKEFSQKLMDAANKNWDEGKDVTFNTMTKTFVVTPKNRSAIRINGSELEVASG
jgi:transketolase